MRLVWYYNKGKFIFTIGWLFEILSCTPIKFVNFELKNFRKFIRHSYSYHRAYEKKRI